MHKDLVHPQKVTLDLMITNQLLQINNGSDLGVRVGGGAGATGGGNDEVFFESDQNVTTSYTCNCQ